MTSARELELLGRTLELASRGAGRVSPNPLVGAVVARDGQVLAEGFHRAAGRAHAEIDALDRLAPGQARGATIYVNLEPCCHQGRTPPCVDRLIEEGIARVVACHGDPDAKVAGRGFARLRSAGVIVEIGSTELCRQAVALNLPFLTTRIEGRAAVTLKWAMSLDGKIATRDGESQWISSPEGRDWALALREQHDAIAVGSGTALQDDPRLTRRSSSDGAAITRIVLDRRLRLQPSARLFSEPGAILVYTEAPSSDASEAHRGRCAALERAGGEVVILETASPLAITRDLARRGINSLLVEGGGEVLEAFVAARCFERVAVCAAAMLIGGRDASPAIAGEGIGRLRDAPRLEGLECSVQGRDVVIVGHAEGRLDALLAALEEQE